MEDRLWKENPPRRVCSYIPTPTLSQDGFRRAKNRATEFGVNLTQAVDIAGSDGRFHRNSIRHSRNQKKRRMRRIKCVQIPCGVGKESQQLNERLICDL